MIGAKRRGAAGPCRQPRAVRVAAVAHEEHVAATGPAARRPAGDDRRTLLAARPVQRRRRPRPARHPPTARPRPRRRHPRRPRAPPRASRARHTDERQAEGDRQPLHRRDAHTQPRERPGPTATASTSRSASRRPAWTERELQPHGQLRGGGFVGAPFPRPFDDGIGDQGAGGRSCGRVERQRHHATTR